MILLLCVVAGSSNASRASVNPRVEVLDETCGSLSPSDLLKVQQGVADYESWSLSYVVNHTFATFVSNCSGSLSLAGTITLDIDDEPVTYNWAIDGGVADVLIWPT